MQKIIKQCKYCGRTHMRGASPAFHHACNNCYKKGHFANVGMFTNKSLNYLGNQNMPRTTPIEALSKCNFFIGTIFDISNELKNINQKINTIAGETNAEWSVTLNTKGTNICYKTDSGPQFNAISEI